MTNLVFLMQNCISVVEFAEQILLYNYKFQWLGWRYIIVLNSILSTSLNLFLSFNYLYLSGSSFIKINV